ncbi:hypothetical protein AB835_12175 [Candidatus Endobugula sertula]|uniref:Uncharacterized protein n=1 Tax=Candidatus Endobugula sertula TaxID=62101 RepID=A0A1D2QMN4_9GAMM|nr:hypothetical protein AB835_12175 [Candidatus Endobugula sertula]
MQLLQENDLGPDIVSVEFESSIRSKASSNVKKLKNKKESKINKIKSNEDGLVRCIDNEACEISDKDYLDSYVIEGMNGEQIVIKEGPNPKCNMILATLFEKYSKNGPTKFYNFFNALYRDRINLGIYVYRKLYFGESKFENTYIDFMGNEIRELG